MKYAVCFFFLSTFSALADGSGTGWTCSDSPKTCATNNTRAAIDAGIAYVSGKAQDGWILTVGTSGQTVDLGSSPLLVTVGNHSFSIRGADINNPTILTSTNGGFPVQLGCGSNKIIDFRYFRMDDFPTCNGFILVTGGGICFHISHCVVNHTNGPDKWMWVGTNFGTGGDGPFGLIDHNTLNGNCTIDIKQNADSVDSEWSMPWAGSGGATLHPITWGTNQFVFIEQNTITGEVVSYPTIATDGNQAGKFVFRHNVVSNATVGWHGRDSGTFSDHCKVGFLMAEVYYNLFTFTDRNAGVPVILVRSGTVRAHDNTVAGDPSFRPGSGVDLETHCTQSSNIGGGEFCRDARDCSLMTAPLAYPADYPDLEQAGWPEPAYIWNNGGSMTYGWGSGSSLFTQSGREFYLSAPPGWTSASDYTYPHPLNEGDVDTAPSNLTAPSLSGEPAIGQTLHCTDGLFAGFPDPTPTLASQWKRCDSGLSTCVNISGETGGDYIVHQADSESRLERCTTANNGVGSPVTTCSNATGTVSGLSPTNLIANPGFEQSTGHDETHYALNDGSWSNWNRNPVSGDPSGLGYMVNAIPTNAKSGSGAVAIIKGWNSPLNVITISQTFGVLPSTTYPLSFWSINEVAGYAPSYSLIDATHSSSLGIDAVVVDHQTWTQTSTTFTTHAGQELATLTFDATSASTGGFTRFDEVQVVPPPAPTATPAATGAPAALRSGKKTILLRKK